MAPTYRVPIAGPGNDDPEHPASRIVNADDADHARELALVKLSGNGWRVTGEPVEVEPEPEPVYKLPDPVEHPASALGAVPIGDPNAELPEHLTRAQRRRFEKELKPGAS